MTGHLTGLRARVQRMTHQQPLRLFLGTLLAGLVSAPVHRAAATPSEQCRDVSGIVGAIREEAYEANFKEYFVAAAPKLGGLSAMLWDQWEGKGPDSQIKDRWNERQSNSILACVSGSTFHGRPIISLRQEANIRSNERPMSSDMFIRIGAPVFNNSRSRAMLVYKSEGASIGGRAVAYMLERKMGHWAIIGRRLLAVS